MPSIKFVWRVFLYAVAVVIRSSPTTSSHRSPNSLDCQIENNSEQWKKRKNGNSSSSSRECPLFSSTVFPNMLLSHLFWNSSTFRKTERGTRFKFSASAPLNFPVISLVRLLFFFFWTNGDRHHLPQSHRRMNEKAAITKTVSCVCCYIFSLLFFISSFFNIRFVIYCIAGQFECATEPRNIELQ